MRQSTPGGNRFRGVKSKVGALATVLLLAIYSVAVPHLNARYGWNLPQINAGGVAEAEPERQSEDRADRSGRARGPEDRGPEDRGPETGGPDSDRMDAELAGGGRSDELEGLVREVAPDRYLSPAGLLYGPGSAEGHRLEHLRRHAQDIPDRPGPHGVFDGGMKGTLQTVDQAYQRAKQGKQTTKEVDGRRTIYTVDMGRRIGFVGGREGGRRQNPAATRVRLVLEGNRVITAYPMNGRN